MNLRCDKLKGHSRRGATLVLAAMFVVLMLVMIGFAVDLGYIVLIRTQLQVAADSAAIAATATHVDSPFGEVVEAASRYAKYHLAGGKNVDLDQADVELGVWDFNSRKFTPSSGSGNAIRVTTRRDERTNGESALFFVKVVGIDSVALKTEATAAFVDNFGGFSPPSTGENLPFLPIAVDKGSSDMLLEGQGTDDWTWDPKSGTVRPGPDGIPEVNIYPQNNPQKRRAAGNFGTVTIGSKNNSTKELSRQILEGLSAEDLAFHGGKLSLDSGGTLDLKGDPGLSAGIKDELEAIKGQGRIVPVFSKLTGVGTNAQYTVEGFAGVRIVEVNLQGKEKRVMIQPATVVVLGGIPAPADSQKSHDIFSPVCLVK